jgi:NifB/MoaA-like Fe-S oxidoreductase
LATGVSAADTIKKMMEELAARVEGFSTQVVPIVNQFFGDTITVSGLITGGDIASQLSGLDLGDALLIPGNSLRDGEELFLDDVTLTELTKRLRVPIIPVPDDGYRLVEQALGLEGDLWE